MKNYDILNFNSYQEYIDVQIHRAESKWNEKTFRRNLNHFKRFAVKTFQVTGCVSKILCMGIRSGNEYFGFKDVAEFSSSDVWGVDICPKVKEVGTNCYCLDFNHLPKEWNDKFDIVYSNSIDHAFDIKATITEWYKVVKPNGYIMLSLSGADSVGRSDIYSFSKEDLVELFTIDMFDIMFSNSYRGFGNAPVIDVLLRVKKLK